MKLENILNSGKRFVSAGLLATSLTFMSCRDEITIINPIVTSTDTVIVTPKDTTKEDKVIITPIDTTKIDTVITPIDTTKIDTVITPIDTTKPVVDEPIESIPVFFFNEPNTRWIDYAPTNFNPEMKQFPDDGSISSDLIVLQKANIDGIVTYASDGTLDNIPKLAKELGFEYVVQGIWDLDSKEEWDNAVNVSPYVDGYCVGNEGLNVRYNLNKLKEKIRDLKKITKKPVTTTETVDNYNEDLFEIVDWVFPNCHPYWNNITDPTSAAQWVVQQYEDISSKTSKQVVLKETGLPSGGGLDENTQNKFYRTLEDLTLTEPKNVFVYFEAFDQPWKDWAPVEPHWGLFKEDRSPKEVSKPQILFTYVPPINTFYDLKGRVVNIEPADYKISVYINVAGTWWMKPYWSNPLTPIQQNSIYTIDITTGGIDHTATEINASIVTNDYVPVHTVLPSLQDKKVIAQLSAKR